MAIDGGIASILRDAARRAAPQDEGGASHSRAYRRLRRSLLMLSFEGRRDLAHEAVHLFLHLRMRLHADVEVEDHLGKAGGLDLLERVGDLGVRAERHTVLRTA